MIAGMPVAAWSERPVPPKIPSSPTAANQVPIETASPTAPPTAIGLRNDEFDPRRLAVIAARTRMHSRPSRKTSTAELMTAVVFDMCRAVAASEGSGVPSPECQPRMTATQATARATATQR